MRDRAYRREQAHRHTLSSARPKDTPKRVIVEQVKTREIRRQLEQTDA